MEGPTKGPAVGNLKAKGDISLPPPPLNINGKQSVGLPFMKKSSDPLKGSATMMTGDNNQKGVGLDTLKANKGIVPEGTLMENKAYSDFLEGLTQSPNMNQINSSDSTKTKDVVDTDEGSAFPLALNTPVKSLAPKEKAADEPSRKKTAFFSGLQQSKGVSKQDSSLPPSPVTELPVSQATAPTTDSAWSTTANDSAASQVASVNTDEVENMVLTAADETWLASLGDIMGEEPTLPLLHVGNRIRSSVHGTTHEGFLVLSMEDTTNGYKVMPCIAKRPWSMTELNATVPSKVLAFEQQRYDAVGDYDLVAPESWELDAKAVAVRRYYEVEIHVFQKFEKKKAFYEQLRRQKQREEQESGSTKDENDSTINNVANIAVPKFLRVYPDDGSGGPRADDAIPQYGSTGLDVWGKALGAGHEWLVYEGRLDAELTLLDAMEMQTRDENIHSGSMHRLYGIQQAMNLPDSEFGDVLDAIFRCLLENLFFLSSCNVVHRNLMPGNILCDGENRRLRFTNFGNAVDLDPPRVGLDNDTLELDAPGSIANTLAADVFSVALIICQLLFDVSDVVLNQQLKDVGYDLDLWLQNALVADSCPMGFGGALDYLRERRGLWSLLKGAIRPNPLRKKITADSLRQFNEVMGLKNGEIEWTDERIKKISREESMIDPLSGSGEPNEGIPPTEARKLENEVSSYSDTETFDITRAPYKMKPPTKSSVSALSELQRKAERSAPTVKASNKANKEAATTSSSEYVDVTRLKFSPTRKSLLTNMLASHGKKRASVKVRQKREGPLHEGNYYDITRAPFQRVSPQPPERKMSQDKAASRASSTIPDDRSDTKAIEVVHIIAPAGKLGVVVDTPPTGGPAYVSSVSDNSPLLGQIYLGDRIVAVDDEDVQRLVADDVSMILLSKSANTVRKISLLREIDDEEEPADISMGETGHDADDTTQVESGDKFAQTDTGKEMVLLTKAQILADEKRCKEVEQWLLSSLPDLKNVDAANYCKCLIDDGFDSLDMLEELIEDDLYFMKTAHRRVMSRKLSWLTNAKTQALPSASDHQSLAVKKVYKVDEALGLAARLGIERKLSEAKRLATEKAEVERKMSGARKRIEAETRAKAEEEARLRKFAAEKAEAERKIQEVKELLQQQLARRDEFERLQDEARRLEETEAWIAEQNELVKKRHRARIVKEKQLKEEEDRYAARQAEFKSLAEEARSLKETEAWIAEQNELVNKRHRARIAKEKQLIEEEETDAARQLEFEDEVKRSKEAESWVTEQNELVKKRHLARIAEENKLKGETGGVLDKGSSGKKTVTTRESELSGTPAKALKSSGKNLVFQVTEGMTAEEAELVRKTRLAVADDEGKVQKL